MDLTGKTVFVAGADGGIGRTLCTQLEDAGARVIRGALVPAPSELPLDVTDPESVALIVEAIGDVDVVINATGIYLPAAPDASVDERLARVEREFQVNTFGMLRLARAVAPCLEARNGRLVNLLSVAAWVALPAHAGYAASKSAAWSFTNSLRIEFAARGVGVSGVVLGYADTEMSAHVEGPKSTPAEIARAILDGIANDDDEILCDDRSRSVKRLLSDDQASIYRPLLDAARNSR